MLPGVYTFTKVFNGEVQYDDAVVSVTAPKNFPLSIENVDLQVKGPEAVGDSLKWTWSYKKAQVNWPEEDAVDPITYRPRLLISSVDTYPKLVTATAERFAEKARVSRRIQTMADQITSGVHNSTEKAKKIYEWVANNIRYFLVQFDVGGYVPRPADEVLSTRHGDCKDHAIVLEALLAAEGIASYTALLSTEPIYDLPSVPVLSGFDHVIVFIRNLNVYLDTNTPSVSFGALPYSDVDKPVLVLGADNPMTHTPPLTSELNTTILTTTITVAADGSATGEDVLTATGTSGISYGGLADMLTGNDPVKLAKGMLLSANLAGEGTAAANHISNSRNFNFTLLYDLKDYAPLDQPGSVLPVAPLDFFGNSARNDVSSAPTRTLPYMCSARTDKEILDIHFPPGVQLTVPHGISVNATNRSYDSSYTLQGRTVHVERRYISNAPREVCPASDFVTVRAARKNPPGFTRRNPLLHEYPLRIPSRIKKGRIYALRNDFDE